MIEKNSVLMNDLCKEHTCCMEVSIRVAQIKVSVVCSDVGIGGRAPHMALSYDTVKAVISIIRYK